MRQPFGASCIDANTTHRTARLMSFPWLTAAPRPPRSIVLLIVDSLRAQSLLGSELSIPFFRRLNAETMCFRRAYATECWTLPSHVSMFTGLLPSEHGAHFQTMAYEQAAPTVAEILAAAGYHTELVTRNFVFDDMIRGVTRGFQVQSRPLAHLPGTNLVALFLALAKPRVRRHIRTTGFFHPRHAELHAFVRTFARSLIPADDLALARVLDVMAAQRRADRPYFICCNLYDVHAPYPPASDSLLQPWTSRRRAAENLATPFLLSKLGCHAYLREGFRLSRWGQGVLRDRYHRAIELMDAKLAAFYGAARAAGLLEDTLLIVTSDHGEAFGEHELYLHDASVYDTHLHVPLWIHHPGRSPRVVDDVVSTRDVFGLIQATAVQERLSETILDADYRARHPIAMAEHFFYPHVPDALPRYRQNLATAVSRTAKVIVRRDGIVHYDLERDPDELTPMQQPLGTFAAACRADGAAGIAVEAAIAHLAQRGAGPGTAAAA